MNKDALVVGIAGGSGSGKTVLSSALRKYWGLERTLLIKEDDYYKDLSGVSLPRRRLVNFDHPDALDMDLLAGHLRVLKAGTAVAAPVYDFTSHTRRPGKRLLRPKPFIIVEGILIFAVPAVRERCDFKVFIDAPADVRLLRRLRRDMTERRRSLESVVEQYENFVRPMQSLFVEPSKAWADLVVDGEQPVSKLARLVSCNLRSRAGKKTSSPRNDLEYPLSIADPAQAAIDPRTMAGVRKKLK